MLKWRAQFNRVEQIECDSESPTQVTIRGRRHHKLTDWQSFHDTREQAVAHIIQQQALKVEQAQRRVDYEAQKLVELKTEFNVV